MKRNNMANVYQRVNSQAKERQTKEKKIGRVVMRELSKRPYPKCDYKVKDAISFTIGEMDRFILILEEGEQAGMFKRVWRYIHDNYVLSFAHSFFMGVIGFGFAKLM